MDGSYKQFCPVAMASEILCGRWTLLILREMVMGSTRFNDLRRGLARLSPALLSKRLKELEAAGVIGRHPAPGEPGVYDYRLTEAGRELRPIVEGVGVWGHRWIETRASLQNLDVELLMWDMRRNIDATPLPRRRSVIQLIYSDLPEARRDWWLLVDPASGVDLCSVDPGFDVDLFLETDLRTMTEIWMGYISLARARDAGRIVATGDRRLEESLQTWLRLSTFAKMERKVA